MNRIMQNSFFEAAWQEIVICYMLLSGCLLYLSTWAESMQTVGNGTHPFLKLQDIPHLKFLKERTAEYYHYLPSAHRTALHYFVSRVYAGGFGNHNTFVLPPIFNSPLALFVEWQYAHLDGNSAGIPILVDHATIQG